MNRQGRSIGWGVRRAEDAQTSATLYMGEGVCAVLTVPSDFPWDLTSFTIREGR